jgi:hypothetical protein
MGQMGMGDKVNGRYMAFLWVGIAYFIVAILGPIMVLKVQGGPLNFFSYPSKGLWLSRIVTAGIDGERPGRTVLEPLIDRQDHELPRPGKPPVIQETGQIRTRTGAVAPVPTEDLGHSILHARVTPSSRGGLSPARLLTSRLANS